MLTGKSPGSIFLTQSGSESIDLKQVVIMALCVEPWDETCDGELTESSLREKLQARGYRVTRYVYPPGTCFPDHSHEIDKMDAVLSGKFRMRMGGESVILEAGDVLAVPRGILHSADVVGGDAVVSLDAVEK